MNKSTRIIYGALTDQPVNQKDYKRKDWYDAYRLSAEHNLHCFVFHFYDQIWSQDFKRTGLYKDWRSNFLSLVMEQKMELAKSKQVLKHMKSEGIQYVLVKGLTLSRLYPNPATRLMGDLDLLVHPRDLSTIKKCLSDEGFTETHRTQKDIAYTKEGALKFEIHHNLFTEADIEYNSWFNQSCLEHALDIGEDYKALSLEDNLTYLLGHIIKHLHSMGCGIAPVYDLSLFLKKHQAVIDFELTANTLNRLGILSSAYYILGVCNFYFGTDVPIPIDLDKDVVEELLMHFFNSGAHGHRADAEVEGNLQHTGDMSILRFLFPSLGYMKTKYNVLDKVPVLLPIFWLIRIVGNAITKTSLTLALLRKARNTNMNMTKKDLLSRMDR